MAIIEFDFSDDEVAALDKMAEETGLSRKQVMRSALGNYQLIRRRIEGGERMSFSGDADRARFFRGPVGLPVADAEEWEAWSKTYLAGNPQVL